METAENLGTKNKSRNRPTPRGISSKVERGSSKSNVEIAKFSCLSLFFIDFLNNTAHSKKCN